MTPPNPADSAPLGIIAGGGMMPPRVAAAARAKGRDVFLVGLDGFADPMLLEEFPHVMVRIGAAGRIIEALRAHRVRDVVLVGSVRRPGLLDLRPDREGTRILAKIGKAVFSGDDSVLKSIVAVLGDLGFNVIGAHDILDRAIGPDGVLTRAGPDAQAIADIARGIAVARKLGEADVGQGCVVQHGLVLAVEAIEGTDEMLRRVGSLQRAGAGGVLVKIVKPGQERRVDLPTIGALTLRNAAAAGLRGVAYDATGTLLAEREEAISVADANGLFILGFDPDRPLPDAV